MQSFSHKKKLQARATDASSVIHGLDSSVKTLIDLLPPEDKEVFAYLITHPSDETKEELVSYERFWKIKGNVASKFPHRCQCVYGSSVEIRKAGYGHRNAYHPPSFVCDCFQCYMSHWSRWNTSSNQLLIHKAILVNECVSHSRSERDLLKVDVMPDGNDSDFIDRYGLDECGDRNFALSNAADVKNFASAGSAPTLNVEENMASDIVPIVVGKEVQKHLNDKVNCGKTTSSRAAVTDKTLHSQGALEIRPTNQFSKEEKKQKKKTGKKVKLPAKGVSDKESLEKIKKGEIPPKYRTKQVAPLMDLKDEAAAETPPFEPEANKLSDASTDSKDEGSREAQPSLSHVFSVTFSFVADRLLSFWYPRRPRGIVIL